jgi:hypothetical protein
VSSRESSPPRVDPTATLIEPLPLICHVTLFVSPGFSQSISMVVR